MRCSAQSLSAVNRTAIAASVSGDNPRRSHQRVYASMHYSGNFLAFRRQEKAVAGGRRPRSTSDPSIREPSTRRRSGPLQPTLQVIQLGPVPSAN